MIINLIVSGPDWFRGPITRYWRLLRPNCAIFADRMRIEWSHSARVYYTAYRDQTFAHTISWVGLQLLCRIEATISSKTSRPTYIKPLCTPMAQRTWRSFILQVRAVVYPSLSVLALLCWVIHLKARGISRQLNFCETREWKKIGKFERRICMRARCLKW